MNSHSPVSHESIARRAYHLWEEAGRPHGAHQDHWHQAERDLRALQAKSTDVDGNRGKSVEPLAPPKHVPDNRLPHTSATIQPKVTPDALHHQRHR